MGGGPAGGADHSGSTGGSGGWSRSGGGVVQPGPSIVERRHGIQGGRSSAGSSVISGAAVTGVGPAADDVGDERRDQQQAQEKQGDREVGAAGLVGLRDARHAAASRAGPRTRARRSRRCAAVVVRGARSRGLSRLGPRARRCRRRRSPATAPAAAGGAVTPAAVVCVGRSATPAPGERAQAAQAGALEADHAADGDVQPACDAAARPRRAAPTPARSVSTRRWEADRSSRQPLAAATASRSLRSRRFARSAASLEAEPDLPRVPDDARPARRSRTSRTSRRETTRPRPCRWTSPRPTSRRGWHRRSRHRRTNRPPEPPGAAAACRTRCRRRRHAGHRRDFHRRYRDLGNLDRRHRDRDLDGRHRDRHLHRWDGELGERGSSDPDRRRARHQYAPDSQLTGLDTASRGL